MDNLDDLTVLEREELLIEQAFTQACQELEMLTGNPSESWEREMIIVLGIHCLQKLKLKSCLKSFRRNRRQRSPKLLEVN